jgi:acetoin utilization protein AcuB
MHQDTVRTWMTPTPITISPEETIIAAYEKMRHHHIRRLPVVEQENLVGIITIGDVRSIISIDTGAKELLIHRTVASAMTPSPITTVTGENVGEAARLMMKHKISGLPVMDEGKLVGVISEADLFRLVIAESWRPQTMTGPGADGEERITTASGECIHIRPIRPDDAQALQASLVKMSPETIYDRFMGYKKVLPDEEARYLASLDYDNHMALVAITTIDNQENIVGVARYHVLSEEAGSAEFAIVISDSYQRQGLGSHLMKRLMEYAQAHAIETFLGYVHEGNVRLLKFIQRSGLPIERKFINGVWEVRVNLHGVPFFEVRNN